MYSRAPGALCNYNTTKSCTTPQRLVKSSYKKKRFNKSSKVSRLVKSSYKKKKFNKNSKVSRLVKSSYKKKVQKYHDGWKKFIQKKSSKVSRLVKKSSYLPIEDFACFAGAERVAQHEPWRDVRLLNASELGLHVLPAVHGIDLVIVSPDHI